MEASSRDQEFGWSVITQRRAILMILPYDLLREAILLELNWAICARRARGVSFDALEREYGLSKEVLAA